MLVNCVAVALPVKFLSVEIVLMIVCGLSEETDVIKNTEGNHFVLPSTSCDISKNQRRSFKTFSKQREQSRKYYAKRYIFEVLSGTVFKDTVSIS